jgi:hypothetical protein
MAKNSNSNSNSNQGVNIGLIVVIFFLFLLVICTGCFHEGFGNVFAHYKIPFIGEKVPSLQNLTVPKFNDYRQTRGTMSGSYGSYGSYGPVVTDPNHIKSLDEEAAEKINKAVMAQETAQAVIDEELEAMEERKNNANRIEPFAKRITPGAAARPRVRPRPKRPAVRPGARR